MSTDETTVGHDTFLDSTFSVEHANQASSSGIRTTQERRL